MSKFENIVDRIAKNRINALLKFSQDLHQRTIEEQTIPWDTGYLATESSLVKIQGDKIVISYQCNYAQYVWEANKTGQPRWLFVTWNRNKREMLHQYYLDLIKG